MNSIQQKTAEFVQNLTELDITIGLSTFIESGYEMFREYFMELASAKVEEVDESIAGNPSVRRGWTVQRKGDARTLVTVHGESKYTRRYYKNERHSEYSYLEGIETISRLRVYACNGGTIKPDDVRKARPARGLTKQAIKKLQKKMSEFEPMPSELFTTPKRGTALYRLFESIKYCGMAI